MGKSFFVNFSLKEFIFGFVFSFFVRILKVFPNNDPIMGCMLPQSRKNIFQGALFAFLAMFIFDFFTSGIGVWTFVTATTYALLALLFGLYFSKKKMHYSNYAFASIVGIIIFDIITGPFMSTFLFKQSFLFTVFAQVPFTISHLVSGVSYTLVLAPVLDLDVRKELLFKVNSIKNFLVLVSNFWRGFF